MCSTTARSMCWIPLAGIFLAVRAVKGWVNASRICERTPPTGPIGFGRQVSDSAGLTTPGSAPTPVGGRGELRSPEAQRDPASSTPALPGKLQHATRVRDAGRALASRRRRVVQAPVPAEGDRQHEGRHLPETERVVEQRFGRVIPAAAAGYTLTPKAASSVLVSVTARSCPFEK